jgi:hypothetical protein
MSVLSPPNENRRNFFHPARLALPENLLRIVIALRDQTTKRSLLPRDTKDRRVAHMLPLIVRAVDGLPNFPGVILVKEHLATVPVGERQVTLLACTGGTKLRKKLQPQNAVKPGQVFTHPVFANRNVETFAS